MGRLVGERSRCVWTLQSGVGVGAWLCDKEVPTNSLTFCPRLHSQLNVFAWCKCQAPRLHRRMHVVYAAMYQTPHLHNRMPSMYQVPHLHNRMHLVCTKPPVCVAGCTWCALGVRWSTKPPICITGCTWWALTQAPHLHSRMHLVCAYLYQAPHLHNRMPSVCPRCALGVSSECPWCALGVSIKPPICIAGCTWCAFVVYQAPHLRCRMHCAKCILYPVLRIGDLVQQAHTKHPCAYQ